MIAKKTVRSVKCWAVICDGKFMSAQMTRDLAVQDRANFGFPSDKIIPAQITYQLPNKGKKGGNK